jgi:conjugal transfer/entry exclusion protein/uncharacterized spore protein YtfJ
MIRKFALLATTAAIVAFPQIAEAGCSGSGCGSVSTTTNYSASDKRVRATVTNKDQTAPIHVKFCVNVDFHCNGFDLTLAPHETVTKDVSYTGSKPPQIHAVDVVIADFPAARASSSGGAAGGGSPSGSSSGSSSSGNGSSSNSGASVALDTPRGKIMVLASKQSVVAPSLAKVSDYFTKLGDFYPEALDRARTMHELVDKLGPIRDVEVEVNKNKNTQVRDEAHIAKEAELAVKHFSVTLRATKSSADQAVSNLKFSEGDLQAAQNLERAKNLRAEAESMTSGVNGILKLAGQAVDIAAASATGATAITQAKSLVGTVQRIVDLVGIVDPLVEKATKLEAEAHKISMDNLAARVVAARQNLRDLKGQIAELQSMLPEYEQLVRNTTTTVEDSYDKLAKAPKSGSRFNFDTLQKAIEACQGTIDYSRKTYEMAYGVRDNIRQIGSRAGDDSAWMAFPGEGRKTLNSMYEAAGPAFDWSVKERQSAEALLKKLTDMYQVARASMQ